MKRKTVLITGAARRLGAAFARHLALRKNYQIALHYNHSEQLATELQLELIEAGVPCEVFRADLQQIDTVPALFENVRRQMGSVDLLINNASIFTNDSIGAIECPKLLSNFQIHAFAPLLLSQALFQQQSDGLIINMLDARVRQNDPAYATYSLSKKTLLNITEYCAVVMAPGVRVNALAPGWVLPAANEEYEIPSKFPNLLNQMGTVQGLVHCLDTLIDNPFLTGQVLYYDGGEHLAGSPYLPTR
ncbi:MAG: SDR family NAD(P)-dependent oxidoreductase [Leptospiraceae bacterium]|nr:SDR family NAD(P)-dependent oxidoreductase [Leptospiraceae bacterium]